MAAEGCRIGYANGNMVEGDAMQLPPEAEMFLQEEYKKYKAQEKSKGVLLSMHKLLIKK